MKNMRLFLAVVLMAAMYSVSWAQGIIVHKTDGTEVRFKANEVDKITTYAEEEPVVTKDIVMKVGNASFKMIYVEGGTFSMGATSEQESDANYDEKPAHSVFLDSYYIGETEVTQELWNEVMNAEYNPSWFVQTSNKPVQNVSKEDCENFINSLNKRTSHTFSLPTEAQWEYAARGGSKTKHYKFSGSNSIDEVGWYSDNAEKEVHEVALKLPNELGIYDMTGNVWEWCSDFYDEFYYTNSDFNNPTGPTTGNYYVFRGGSYDMSERNSRITTRNFRVPTYHYGHLGLRLVMKVEE